MVASAEELPEPLARQARIAGELTVGDAPKTIRELRERFGFTQDRLAGMLEVRRETLSRIESGHLQPSFSVVQRFSAVAALAELAREHAARSEGHGAEPDAGHLEGLGKTLRLPPEVASVVVETALASYRRKREQLLKNLE